MWYHGCSDAGQKGWKGGKVRAVKNNRRECITAGGDDVERLIPLMGGEGFPVECTGTAHDSVKKKIEVKNSWLRMIGGSSMRK